MENTYPIVVGKSHLPKDVVDYILVCGEFCDPPSYCKMVEEIHSSDIREDVRKPVVVLFPYSSTASPEQMERDLKWELTPKELEEWEPLSPRDESIPHPYRDVYILFGHPREEQSLDRAGLERAKCALVLSRPRGQMLKVSREGQEEMDLEERADEEVAMVAWTLKDTFHRLYQQRGEGNLGHLHVGVELQNTKHRRNLVRMGVEDIVSADALEEKLLAHACLAPTLSYTFVELVTPEKYGTELYLEEIPETLGAKCYFEVAKAFFARGRIALGLLRKHTKTLIQAGAYEEYAPSNNQVLLHPPLWEKIDPKRDMVFVIGYRPLTDKGKLALKIPEDQRISTLKLWLKRWNLWMISQKKIIFAFLLLALVTGALYYFQPDFFWDWLNENLPDVMEWLAPK